MEKFTCTCRDNECTSYDIFSPRHVKTKTGQYKGMILQSIHECSLNRKVCKNHLLLDLEQRQANMKQSEITIEIEEEFRNELFNIIKI